MQTVQIGHAHGAISPHRLMIKRLIIFLRRTAQVRDIDSISHLFDVEGWNIADGIKDGRHFKANFVLKSKLQIPSDGF